MTLYYESELCHYGIPGMKWGIRRFLKNRRALASAAKARRGADKLIKNERKNAYNNRRFLSDADLNARIDRLKRENQFKALVDDDIRPGRSAVKKFLKSSGGKVLATAATGAMAYAGYQFMEDKGWVKAASYMFPNPNKKK